MKKRLLIQTQLSNLDHTTKRFDLACDSGWQMVMGRVREMLHLCPELEVTVTCPIVERGWPPSGEVVEHPEDVYPDLWRDHGDDGDRRLRYAMVHVPRNALQTRFDFNTAEFAAAVGVSNGSSLPRYDAVYVNDPMQLRNLKAMFHIVGGYRPRFYVHSHFVDLPEVPKFPRDCSLWLGQCEAAIRADHNFWQCRSAMEQFLASLHGWFVEGTVDDVAGRSQPWDDGYSMTEINVPVNEEEMSFSAVDWHAKTAGKVVLFFPNRISPASGDYTNGVHFMEQVLPALRTYRDDFVVVCGNPNQKMSNRELEERYSQHGYIRLSDGSFDRNEYRFVARNSHIALGFYNSDAYGGTASRECVELGSVPVWLDNHEYASLAREAKLHDELLARPDMSDIVDVLVRVIQAAKSPNWRHGTNVRMRNVVRDRCAYEVTTRSAMQTMGLI